MIKQILHIFLLLMLFNTASIFGDQAFISKSGVDSLVDKALYLFNSVSDPGSGITTEYAIQKSKEICAKLRSFTSKDINEKYILFQIDELEAQIYLEENGLLAEKTLWNKKLANEAINAYNIEIANQHPDFSNLWKIHAQISNLDSIHAEQMENSIKKRALQLSKELNDFIETGFEDRNFDVVRNCIIYCKSNQGFLAMPQTLLASYEANLIKSTTLAEELKQLENELETLIFFVHTYKLPEARKISSSIQFRLQSLKSSIPQVQWNRFNDKHLLYSRKINNKEDSLVHINLAILKNSGISAAEKYMDTLKLFGISEKKYAKVDRAILEKIIEKKQVDTRYDVGSYTFDEDTSENTFFNDLLVSSRIKVAQKYDSLEQLEQQNTQISHVAEIRRERLVVSAQEQQKRALARYEFNKIKANEELVTIYAFVQKKDYKKATEHFEKVTKLLQNNLSGDELLKVKHAIYDKSLSEKAE